MTLESLVTTQEGRNTGKAIMTALVNHQIRDDIGIDVISSVLQQRCPSICQPNDVVLYKGMELLQSAKALVHEEQRIKVLSEAQNLFSSIIKDVGLDRLRDITESYKSLKFYTGVLFLDLVLETRGDNSEMV